MNFFRWSRPAQPSAPRPVTEPISADAVLARLHTTASSTRASLPSAVLSATVTLLNSPSTPAATISAVLTALCQLPPSALPASHTSPLASAIANAAHRARAVLASADFRHAARIVTQLAARSDFAALCVCTSSAAHRLTRAASAAASADSVLREDLRRMTVVSGMRADEFHALLSAPHGGFRSRAEKLVLAAAAGHRRPLRILALDGGGTRAVLALQVLKRIETLTGTPIRDSFDLIAGTSTGGVLAVAIGLLGKSLQECEDLYLQFARDVFTMKGGQPGKTTSSGIYHAGKVLLLNRGMYNTKALNRLYETHCGPARFFEHAGGHGTPRVFVLSTQIKSKDSRADTTRPYLHANYHLPSSTERRPRYSHGCLHRLSEALRATTAAPVYFDPFTDDDGEVFCDGAVLVNNPTSVAIHEARCLWPGRPLGVVVSVGTGLFNETGDEMAMKRSEKGGGRVVTEAGNGENTKTGDTNATDARNRKERRGSLPFRVAQAVLESATDTEGVHHTLEDLIESDDVYFRLNPELEGERILLDEYRPDVLKRLGAMGREYATASGEGAEKIKQLCYKLNTLRRPALPVYGMWRPKAARSYARL